MLSGIVEPGKRAKQNSYFLAERAVWARVL